MAYIFLTGTAKWVKITKPDSLYGHYGLDLYLDKGSMEKFKESGLTLKLREDEDGTFVKLRRDPEKVLNGEVVKFGAPKLLIFEDGEYKPFDRLVGNGSFVNCKVRTFDTKNGVGHRLEAVAVENLVPYDGEDDSDLPF